MSKILTHGLSALMEACKLSEEAEMENEALFVAFEEAIDDDIIDAVTGRNMDDTVENDMDGEGVGDDEEMEKLLSKIPPADKDVDEQIDDLVESVIPIDLGRYVW
jgi:hypothetical protein